MDKDDQILKKIIKLLTKNNINFWICHGTLLGIIREKRLLPWDRDIDIAVWDHETDRDFVAEIFEKEGFKQEYFFADVDSLHFSRVGKNIDINFFKKNNTIASWKGAVAMDGFFNKLIIHFGHIVNLDDLKKIEFPNNKFKRFAYLFFIILVLLLRLLSPNFLKDRIYQSALKRIKYFGYSYPIESLELKKMDYKGFEIQVPNDPEKCLELTYGVNWKTPKKDYIWHKDASNLVKG